MIGSGTARSPEGPDPHGAVSLPAASIEIGFASVVRVTLTGQTGAGKPIIALIGRDVLEARQFASLRQTARVP